MSNLKYVPGRIICKIDLEQKNQFTFSNGTTIRLERQFDNFDRKYTEQVMGVVISAENVPTDALILFHHNSTHDSYRIHNHSQLSGEEIASDIKIFSIMERDCFFWKMPGEEKWNCMPGYATGLRIFIPYAGVLEGIPPKPIKDTLYVTSGEYKGIVVKTLPASDYMITFRNEKGVDENIIRFRPDGIASEEREPEAIAIMEGLTQGVSEGNIWVGLSISDCKPINDYNVYGMNEKINAYAD